MIRATISMQPMAISTVSILAYASVFGTMVNIGMYCFGPGLEIGLNIFQITAIITRELIADHIHCIRLFE